MDLLSTEGHAGGGVGGGGGGGGGFGLADAQFSAAPSRTGARFDAVVGALESLVMGGAPGAEGACLQEELEDWCRLHCGVFADAPPDAATNTDHPRAAVWYDLYAQHEALVEARIDAALAQLDPPCLPDELTALMTEHADELSGDVFDLLMSLGDYSEFVQLMVSYAQQVAFEAGRRTGGGGGGGGGGKAAEEGDDGAGDARLPSYVGLAPTVTRVVGAEALEGEE